LIRPGKDTTDIDGCFRAKDPSKFEIFFPTSAGAARDNGRMSAFPLRRLGLIFVEISPGILLGLFVPPSGNPCADMQLNQLDLQLGFNR